MYGKPIFFSWLPGRKRIGSESCSFSFANSDNMILTSKLSFTKLHARNLRIRHLHPLDGFWPRAKTKTAKQSLYESCTSGCVCVHTQQHSIILHTLVRLFNQEQKQSECTFLLWFMTWVCCWIFMNAYTLVRTYSRIHCKRFCSQK